ncbi:hypothetical protein Fcan01_25521 [Folsomia candida]|uniref:Uncharacterized protein n=1 Tax=Folsomia candida TaxID=158441 RepID=A0A226D260_FOLCA|nr:hypothetical protein Fcan01_25521 [Folsomia candida]
MSLARYVRHLLVPRDWTESFTELLNVGYFLVSLPFVTTKEGNLAVTRKSWRITVLWGMLLVSTMDTFYRAVVCTKVNYKEMKSKDIMQMYIDLFSRSGATIVCWDIFAKMETHANFVNHIFSMNARLTGGYDMGYNERSHDNAYFISHRNSQFIQQRSEKLCLNAILICHVTINVMLISMHDSIPRGLLGMLLITLVMFLLFERNCIKACAKMYEESKKFKRIIAASGHLRQRKVARSLRPLKVFVGSYYYFKMSTFMTYVNTVVDYTIDFLIANN